MSFLKELTTLIGLLFSENPKKAEKLEIMEMKYFPFSGYLAMTWCGKIITRNPEKIDDVTVNHETIHLNQAKQYSSWLSFYIEYLIQWLKGKPMKSPFNSAYYTIPFEVEAYANEDDMKYCVNYTTDNLKGKYTLNDRKKLYIDAGGSPYLWKKFVKTL